MFLLIILVMVIMVAITAALPQITGLAKYTSNPDYQLKKKEREDSEHSNREARSSASQTNSYVYQAPDADLDDDEITEEITSGTSSAFKGVRSTLKKIAETKITERDIPIKLELSGESELKRRARHGTDGKRLHVTGVTRADPTSYDYDIDELIDEENANDYKEKLKSAQASYGRAEV